MVSTRFTQYQTVICNYLRKSSHNDVVRIYYDTICVTIQYDQFKPTKEVITQYRKNKEDRMKNVLTRQSLVNKSIWEHGMKPGAEIWSRSISKMLNNIYNFSMYYVNNSQANASNMHK